MAGQHAGQVRNTPGLSPNATCDKRLSSAAAEHAARQDVPRNAVVMRETITWNTERPELSMSPTT